MGEPAAETGPGQMEEAAKLKDEGNSKFKAGDFQGAVADYSRSLELDDSQHVLYSNRSAAYVKLGNSAEEALRDAEKCVVLKPDWPKGYNRKAAALQELKRWDEAIAACEKGLQLGADASLTNMMSEVRTKRFKERLCGTWHGTVNEVLGGYDQEMQFMENMSVRVAVLGRAIVGRYTLKVDVTPHHLDIQVPMADVPPGCPPPPPVPYIARIDEKGLHLCCPFMKMERPTEFEGPGYCLMLAGSLEDQQDNKDLETLSNEEKIMLCAQEMASALPDRSLQEPSQADSEEETRDKLMAQVKFEASMYSLQKRFGEDTMKEVLNGCQKKNDAPQCLKGTQELKTLTENLQRCGLVDDSETARSEPPPPPATGSKPPPPSKPPPGMYAEVPDSSKTPASQATSSDSDSTMQVIVAASIAIAAVAGVAFFLSRRQKH